MYRTWIGGLARCVAALAVVMATDVALAQDAAKPAEQVDGSGGHMLRYSSTQVEVKLSEQDQQTFQRVRDHRYGARLDLTMDAVLATLREQGYATPAVDRDFHLVEARHDEVLISKGREILRGALKARMPLPAKPDHQVTEAMILLMPATDGQSVLARARFRRTVWDSNGDSRTSVLSDAATYDRFYDALALHLAH